jgi:hypothetical protein
MGTKCRRTADTDSVEKARANAARNHFSVFTTETDGHGLMDGV